MKRSTVVILLAALLTALLSPAVGAERVSAAPLPASPDRSPAAPIANTIAAVTGIAISPLLGTGAYGAWHYFRAVPELRARLPWFAQPVFFVPALLIVGICAAKDALGAVVPPLLKKPLDVLEAVENQLSALVAAGAVIPLIIGSLSQSLVAAEPTALASDLVPSGLAMIHLANASFAGVLTVLLVPLALVIFAVVWMAGHAVNVLILLSPWGAIDTALKSARTALLAGLTVGAVLNPWVGAAIAGAVTIAAYLLAGWAFRLTVFGTVFSWDFLTARRRYFKPGETGNAVFTGPALTGTPVRSYGRLERGAEGELRFVRRPKLAGVGEPKVVPAAAMVIGKGLFFSAVMTEEGDTFFILPPRYTGHEEELARIYGVSHVRPAGLRKAWGLLRELLGGAAAQTQVV